MRVDNVYKLDMSGATDNAPELAHLATDIAALYAAKKPLPRLTFPEGVIAFSKWPNLAYPHIEVVAEGECHLKFIGTGDAVTFDASIVGNKSEPGLDDITFTGFMIDIANSVGSGLVLNACHRSFFDVWITGPGEWSSAYPGITIKFGIITEIRPCVHGFGIGMVMDACPGRPDLPPTIWTISQPKIEGCGYGLYIKSADKTRVYGGTIESCNIGVQIDGGGNNHFYAIDMEGNRTYDAVTSSSTHDNKFFYCTGRPSTFKSNFQGWNNRLIHDLQDGLFGL